MKSDRQSLWVLRAVAAVFVSGGVLALVMSFYPSPSSHYVLWLGLTDLVVGIGLLRRGGPWRSVAVLVLWLQLVVFGGIIVSLFVTNEPLVIGLPWFSLLFEGAPRLVPIAVLALVGLLTLWALTRPGVARELAAHT